MTEKCIDEGTIQAFLDSELTPDKSDQVSRHISICDSCANLAADAEAEISFTFTALEREHDELIPTRRLWTKINSSIASESRNRSVWNAVWEFLTSPPAIAFASILIVFGLFVGLLGVVGPDAGAPVVQSVKDPAPDRPIRAALTQPAAESETETAVHRQVETPGDVAENDIRIVQANLPAESAAPVVRNSPARLAASVRPADIAVPRPVAGEESYVRTIATLDRTVGDAKDQVLRPSARFSFERDLAVANAAINRLQQEIRENPGNSAARELLRSSYQDKINLLNSVAEKSELMATVY